jgi:hypothetical protein
MLAQKPGMQFVHEALLLEIGKKLRTCTALRRA